MASTVPEDAHFANRDISHVSAARMCAMTSARQRPVPTGTIRRRLPLACVVLGLALLVAGTFLPWLASGVALRNSYQSMALAGRLTPLGDGVSGAALAAWPGIGGISAACLVLYLVGLRRTAACCVLLVAVAVGTVAALAVVVLPTGDAAISAVLSGPLVTLTGAALATIGAVTTLARPANRASKSAGGA
jgi:hypothetical protein